MLYNPNYTYTYEYIFWGGPWHVEDGIIVNWVGIRE